MIRTAAPYRLMCLLNCTSILFCMSDTYKSSLLPFGKCANSDEAVSAQPGISVPPTSALRNDRIVSREGSILARTEETRLFTFAAVFFQSRSAEANLYGSLPAC